MSEYPTLERNISIHAPRAGSDQSLRPGVGILLRFQSTLPVRGATLTPAAVQELISISIHAPRAGSDLWVQSIRVARPISIHAPRAGSDHR